MQQESPLNPDWHMKFNYGDIVQVCGQDIEKHPDLKKLLYKYLIVDSCRFYQSCHYRPECWADSYFVYPAEFKGFEHDEGLWVGGCNLTKARYY